MKPSAQNSDAWTLGRFRLIRQRHRGANRSTTWRLATHWGREPRGITGAEITWHHRNREGGKW